MTKKSLPKTRQALNTAANNGQINYFITPPELADYYYAKISETTLPGFRGKLLDYYVEASDSLGNTHKSEIQHVFVEDDGISPIPPSTPNGLSANATSSGTVSLAWSPVTGATSYKIFRNDSQIATTSSPSFTDNSTAPNTTYTYRIIASNAHGDSAPSAPVTITTPDTSSPPPSNKPPPFQLTGHAPPGYLISNHGMTVYAAVRGTKLYVATWFASVSNANDHFVLVSPTLLASASSPLMPGWSKAGLAAVPNTAVVLCMESTNGWIGWQRHDSGGSNIPGQTAKNPSGQMEGVIDLVETFGSMPEILYIASLAIPTNNNTSLVAQAPTPVVQNANLEPSEFLALPIPSIRDSIGDSRLDLLSPTRGFRAFLQAASPAGYKITWPSVPGKTYRVKYKNSLHDSNWHADLPGSLLHTPVNTTTMEFTDPTTHQSRRFYTIEPVE